MVYFSLPCRLLNGKPQGSLIDWFSSLNLHSHLPIKSMFIALGNLSMMHLQPADRSKAGDHLIKLTQVPFSAGKRQRYPCEIRLCRVKLV